MFEAEQVNIEGRRPSPVARDKHPLCLSSSGFPTDQPPSTNAISNIQGRTRRLGKGRMLGR